MDEIISAWTVDVRDPYCGGWVPLRILLKQDDDGKITYLSITNTEGHTVELDTKDSETFNG